MESPKILILEDEGPVRELLVSKFSAAGFQTLDAATGEQAIEIALKERPDVIITDIVMYPMDGTTFLEKIRESGVWGAHIPCYVFSNQNDPEIIRRLKTIGIQRYISKSETPMDKVAAMIKEDLAK